MRIQQIAILGGGTAGWLTANHLGKALQHRQDVQITVIEAPTIPTIGVGEGTVPMMRQTLKHLGIDEHQFIAECDVTFKQSIKFVNWLDKHKHGVSNAYHHLFDFPFPFPEDLTPAWMAQRQSASARPFTDYVSIQGHLCDANRAPKRLNAKPFTGEASYAYHLNAKKFAGLLSRHGQQHFAIRYLPATVVDVELTVTGDIANLVTEEHGRLPFDFFVDCSGFSSLLLGKKLGVPFVDKSDELQIDAALAVQVPTAEDAAIPCYTIATAHQAGWIWDIALTERRGVGFVYSSKFMSQQQAEQRLDRYLGGQLAQLSPRHIPMPVGYRQRFWQGNCVAIGLAQGFVEPLEATAILVTDFSARLLADNFPLVAAQHGQLAAWFNQRVHTCWQRVMDFIKLHYVLSDRTDSPFWLAMRDPTTISTNLAGLLEKWRYQLPSATDFFSKFEVFDLENYLYVLYGMHYPTLTPATAADYPDIASQRLQQIDDVASKLIRELPSHRQWLAALTRRN